MDAPVPVPDTLKYPAHSPENVGPSDNSSAASVREDAILQSSVTGTPFEPFDSFKTTMENSPSIRSPAIEAHYDEGYLLPGLIHPRSSRSSLVSDADYMEEICIIHRDKQTRKSIVRVALDTQSQVDVLSSHVASKCGYIDLEDCEDVVFVSLNSTKICPKGRVNNVEWHFRQKERTYKNDWYVADMPFDAILGQKSIHQYKLLL